MNTTEPTTSPALQVALEYHQAWTTGSIDQALELVATDVVCDAPRGRLTGIEAYRPFLANFQPLVLGYEMISALGDEETAVLVYELHTAPVTSALTCECFTVRDGQIIHNRLIFDQTPYAAATPAPSAPPSPQSS